MACSLAGNARWTGTISNLFGDGWKITERIQSYLRRDGNRAVVAR
jgi:hypothetical protein